MVSFIYLQILWWMALTFKKRRFSGLMCCAGLGVKDSLEVWVMLRKKDGRVAVS